MALIASENLSSCPECGAVVPVSRIEVHEDWHTAQEKAQQPAAGVELDPWPEPIADTSSL